MDEVRARDRIELVPGTEIDRIVVPITLDHRWDRGVSFATQLADQWRLPIRLVTVVVGAEDAVSLESGRALEEARSALEKAHPELVVSDEVLAAGARPELGLVKALEPGDLIVLATESAGSGDRAWSFAQALAHEWTGPVVMIGPAAAIDRTRGDVVVGVDGSVLGERGLPLAKGLASLLDTHLWVIHVIPAVMTAHIEQLRARGERVSENGYVRDVAERLGGSGSSWEVVHADDAAAALVDVVRDRGAAFLVMATHGASGLVRPSFGSVCMDAVRQCSRPVVVIRPTPVPELTIP